MDFGRQNYAPLPVCPVIKIDHSSLKIREDSYLVLSSSVLLTPPINLIADFRVAGKILGFDPAFANLLRRFDFCSVILRFLPLVHQHGSLVGDLTPQFGWIHIFAKLASR